MRPDDCKYTETHEWVKYSDKKKEAVIGITDYAIKQLSDLVHLELPKTGEALEQGAPFGEVESVKTVADLVSPISGKVLESNKAATNDLDLLKDEPFEDGWLIKVKVSDPSEIESLMTRKEYEEFLESSEEEEEEDEEESEDVDEDDFV